VSPENDVVLTRDPIPDAEVDRDSTVTIWVAQMPEAEQD
jgi:hypothetical protein